MSEETARVLFSACASSDSDGQGTKSPDLPEIADPGARRAALHGPGEGEGGRGTPLAAHRRSVYQHPGWGWWNEACYWERHSLVAAEKMQRPLSHDMCTAQGRLCFIKCTLSLSVCCVRTFIMVPTSWHLGDLALCPRQAARLLLGSHSVATDVHLPLASLFLRQHSE